MSSNQWERVGRLIGEDNLDRLSQTRVGVIGLGSGGGFVALSLAMSGVGSFALVDNDVLERVNITRHVADLRNLGQNKAAAVADLIWQRNPDARIEVREGAIEDHWDCLADLDILVVAVDNEQVKYAINEKCLELRLSASLRRRLRTRRRRRPCHHQALRRDPATPAGRKPPAKASKSP